MKNFILILFILLFQNLCVFANNLSIIYTENNKVFGLKDIDNNIITKPIYKKIIPLDNDCYIVQNKVNKYGLITNDGKIIVKPQYLNTERILGKYAKLGNFNNYGLYNSNGTIILPHQYSSIDLLFGGMLLTCKNYKYGIADFTGNIILENKFEDIYMPKSNIIRIKHEGQWYEIKQEKSETLTLPKDMETIKENKEYTITNIMTTTTAASGYTVITFTDYLIKMFSSISPAHEQTIDELMFLKGTDSINIIMKFSWLPKYPFTYAKNYYNILKNPNNGPFSDVKSKLKKQIN